MPEKRDGLLVKWGAALKKRTDEKIRINPSAFGRGDPDVLRINQVCEILDCTKDHVYRIPDDKLPAHGGGGRGNIYLRDELIEYIRNEPRRRFNSSSVPHNYQSNINTEAESNNVIEFDAEAALARLKGFQDGQA